ncbi:probable G-protein coupled receptor 141 [Oncorhynchus masou masou]|uniref:probable G-protein coupled receptor 141 n=1 Tax=Oncorhynchus masou masou TaxID=90313 RepID=UPI003182EA41
MSQGSVQNSWKLKMSQFFNGLYTQQPCHPLSMFGMLCIDVIRRYVIVMSMTIFLMLLSLMTHFLTSRRVMLWRTFALIASVAVWVVTFVVIFPILYFNYGKEVHEDTSKMASNDSHCFQFGSHLKNHSGVKKLNYIMSSVIVIVVCVQTALQCHVMSLLTRKYELDCMLHQEFTSNSPGIHQEFWAQLKSLCFAVVLLVCFMPYQMFRIYYLEHLQQLEHTNEVFLSLTALRCLDMFTFLERGHCYMCDLFSHYQNLAVILLPF